MPRWCDYYCASAMHLWCIASWSWVQYIFGVASLVLCIVSYIAQACYRSGASTLLLCHKIFMKIQIHITTLRSCHYSLVVELIVQGSIDWFRRRRGNFCRFSDCSVRESWWYIADVIIIGIDIPICPALHLCPAFPRADAGLGCRLQMWQIISIALERYSWCHSSIG